MIQTCRSFTLHSVHKHASFCFRVQIYRDLLILSQITSSFFCSKSHFSSKSAEQSRQNIHCNTHFHIVLHANAPNSPISVFRQSNFPLYKHTIVQIIQPFLLLVLPSTSLYQLFCSSYDTCTAIGRSYFQSIHLLNRIFHF